MDSKKALDRRDFLKAAGAMGALFGLGARGFSAELAAKPLNPPHRKSRLQNL